MGLHLHVAYTSVPEAAQGLAAVNASYGKSRTMQHTQLPRQRGGHSSRLPAGPACGLPHKSAQGRAGKGSATAHHTSMAAAHQRKKKDMSESADCTQPLAPQHCAERHRCARHRPRPNGRAQALSLCPAILCTLRSSRPAPACLCLLMRSPGNMYPSHSHSGAPPAPHPNMWRTYPRPCASPGTSTASAAVSNRNRGWNNTPWAHTRISGASAQDKQRAAARHRPAAGGTSPRTHRRCTRARLRPCR